MLLKKLCQTELIWVSILQWSRVCKLILIVSSAKERLHHLANCHWEAPEMRGCRWRRKAGSFNPGSVNKSASQVVGALFRELGTCSRAISGTCRRTISLSSWCMLRIPGDYVTNTRNWCAKDVLAKVLLGKFAGTPWKANLILLSSANSRKPRNLLLRCALASVHYLEKIVKRFTKSKT